MFLMVSTLNLSLNLFNDSLLALKARFPLPFHLSSESHRIFLRFLPQHIAVNGYSYLPPRNLRLLLPSLTLYHAL